MSEYQYYEFVALDRPLTPKEMDELRSISTRAEITATHFRNEYDWGDLKADPAKLLARYFDAHLYFANWGTHRFMLRLPAGSVDQKALRPYFVGQATTMTKVGRHLVIDLGSDIEEPEDDWYDNYELAVLSPLRSNLLHGDVSIAYLAWLLAVQSEEVDDDDIEPPPPVGPSKGSASLAALARFLRLDPDLHVAGASRTKSRRTVSEIRERAAQLREARERDEAARAARARAKKQALRKRGLDRLAQQGTKPWIRLEFLVDRKRYDEAIRLTVDLHDLTERSRASRQFQAKLDALKKRHPRRRGYLDAIKRRDLARQPDRG